MPIDRNEILRSLEQQRRLLAQSIVLTPVDSLPFALADRRSTAFLHGVYLTDKMRDLDARRNAIIQFGGREQAAEDINEIHRLMAEALGAAQGSLRLLAGLQAHAATFMSIGAAGQTVMLLGEDAGGHFSTHAILERLGLRTIDLPLDSDRFCIDRDATLELVATASPDFVFVDRSEGLRYEDFSFIGALQGPTTIFDASQYITQILTGRYPNPLRWGFDLMMFTLHKSFPGPQKAAIVTREDDAVWKLLLSGLSTLVSSSHAENTYLAGLTFLRTQELETYAQRLLGTASELEHQLGRQGVAVFPRTRQGDPEWPATHHIWLQGDGRDAAFAQFEALTASNIQTNYRKLPYGLGYGIRLGTSFSSVAGVDIRHTVELAEIIAAALSEGPSASLRTRVRDLAYDARASALLAPEQWI